MERESLKAIFCEAADSGWYLQSDIQLQEWLESFSKRLEERTDILADEVHKLVEATFCVEQELHNTFNHFRSLSNSQFIENRVYEEDETSIKPPEPVANEQPDTTEGYESGIVARYKEAVLTAWGIFEDHKLASKHGISTGFDKTRGKVHHTLPFVIGTEEFSRDVNCGLAALRYRSSIPDVSALESDNESNEADLAAEMGGRAIPSEGDWSDSSETQGEGLEPAVSAALDFKAMLEAALRGPSLPYTDDDDPSPTYGSSYSYFGMVENVPTVADDHMLHNQSQRTMSENREQTIAEEYGEASAAASDDHIRSNAIRYHSVDGQAEPTANSLDPAEGRETDVMGGETQFQFPVVHLQGREIWTDIEKSVQDLVSDQESRASNGSKRGNLVTSPSQSFSNSSLRDLPVSLEQPLENGTSMAPTVPAELFGSSRASSKLGSFSGKVSDSKGPQQESIQQTGNLAEASKPEGSNAAKSQVTFQTSQRPKEPVTVSGAGKMVDKPAVSGSAVPKESRGGLFDGDDDEDDSYVARLMKQRLTASNQNKVFRSWSKIDAGKGLFDESDDALSPDDGQAHFEGSVDSHVGPSAPSAAMSTPPGHQALTGRRQEPMFSGNESLSWSSSEKDDQTPGGLNVKSLPTFRSPAHSEPSRKIRNSIDQSPMETPSPDDTRSYEEVTAAEGLRAHPIIFKGSETIEDERVVESLLQRDQSGCVEDSCTGHEFKEKAHADNVTAGSLARRSVGDANPKASWDKRFSLFDDGDVIFGGKSGSTLVPALSFPGVQQNWRSPRFTGDSGTEQVSDKVAVDTLSDAGVDSPAESLMLLASSSSRQSNAEISKSLGSAYLSSILFGDEEDNEDELFGTFQKGMDRRSSSDHSSGKQSKPTFVFDGDTADSPGKNESSSKESSGVAGFEPQVRPSSSIPDREPRRRSLLFDD